MNNDSGLSLGGRAQPSPLGTGPAATGRVRRWAASCAAVALLAAVLFLANLANLAMYSLGGLDNDSRNQYAEAISGHYTDWHVVAVLAMPATQAINRVLFQAQARDAAHSLFLFDLAGIAARAVAAATVAVLPQLAAAWRGGSRILRGGAGALGLVVAIGIAARLLDFQAWMK